MSLHNLNFNVTIDFNCSQSTFPEETTLRRHLIATPLRDLYWILNSFGFLTFILETVSSSVSMKGNHTTCILMFVATAIIKGNALLCSPPPFKHLLNDILH